MVLQPDGKIVVVGLSDASGLFDDFALARYHTDGRLDSTFDSDGKVLSDFSGSGSVDIPHALAIDSSGRLVVAGWSDGGGQNSDFAIARYHSDGSLDSSFNSSGKVLTDFGSSGNYNEEALAIAIDDNGRIVLAGYCFASGGSDFAVARYDSDGTLDATFN
jgi:uncharacterized delta-60 repeat protein